MTRPRLVHVTTTDMSLALLLGPQLRAFRDAGYEVVGVSKAGPWVAQLSSWGIDHVPLRHATRAVAPAEDLRALAELLALFRALRPAIVHTHNPKPGIYGRAAAALAGVPVIVNTVHGLYAAADDPLGRRLVVYCLERLAACVSHAELVQSAEDLETLRKLGVPEHRLVHLGNGVDLGRFHPQRDPAVRAAARAELGLSEGEVAVGVVGRLVVEKGYREVLQAAELLRGAPVAVRMVLVGPEEPDKADSLSAAELERARATPGVTLLGYRDDMERLYSAFDIFVLPSHREGFPRAAMEAAACGLAVVATDVRGCREVVDHARTGLLVPVRSPRWLASAICELAGDPERRRRLGAAGARKARRDFDDRRVVATTLATYERLLEASRGQRRPRWAIGR